jgi:hypothetical protein
MGELASRWGIEGILGVYKEGQHYKSLIENGECE